jgi:flagellin-like hook-associated protein FlgL
MADQVAAARIEGTQSARGRLVDLDVASAVTTLKNAQGLNQLGAKALTIQSQQRGAILDLLI